ncbi:hypothetical protein BD626DRAFT_492770 [Schizophyllum amplum]|uniref:Uncharacterized protein n=1 Tax=Schizophyllum amplum TaxID=97359 RepID=A0A550CGC0_9AGAR|nr:hypothetical protein BD626DRAFT_492770 [Auriculariopsis ampla]
MIDDDTRHLQAYADTCLVLSGSHGLTVQCDSSVRLPTVLRMLLPHASRWRAVGLRGSFDDTLALSRSRRSFPSLRCVSIAIWTLSSASPGLFDFLTGSSQLNTLFVDALACDEDYFFAWFSLFLL